MSVHMMMVCQKLFSMHSHIRFKPSLKFALVRHTNLNEMNTPLRRLSFKIEILINVPLRN
jgi:hypothetical protein